MCDSELPAGLAAFPSCRDRRHGVRHLDVAGQCQPLGVAAPADRAEDQHADDVGDTFVDTPPCWPTAMSSPPPNSPPDRCRCRQTGVAQSRPADDHDQFRTAPGDTGSGRHVHGIVRLAATRTILRSGVVDYLVIDDELAHALLVDSPMLVETTGSQRRVDTDIR